MPNGSGIMGDITDWYRKLAATQKPSGDVGSELLAKQRQIDQYNQAYGPLLPPASSAAPTHQQPGVMGDIEDYLRHLVAPLMKGKK